VQLLPRPSNERPVARPQPLEAQLSVARPQPSEVQQPRLSAAHPQPSEVQLAQLSTAHPQPSEVQLAQLSVARPQPSRLPCMVPLPSLSTSLSPFATPSVVQPQLAAALQHHHFHRVHPHHL